jgi:hypothetical protein
MNGRSNSGQLLIRGVSFVISILLAVKYISVVRSNVAADEELYRQTRTEFRHKMRQNLSVFRKKMESPEIVADVQPFSGDDAKFNSAILTVREGWDRLSDREKTDLQYSWASTWCHVVFLNYGSGEKPRLWIRKLDGHLIEVYGLSNQQWEQRLRRRLLQPSPNR